jgi:hypothetical protein
MLAAAPALPSQPARAISADELCRAVRERSAGRDSWTMPGLDRVLRHDTRTGLLEVQAGVPWSSLAGVEGTSSFRGTVGQAVAENWPGPDGRPLVAHLRSLTMATPDGQLRRASRESAGDLFRHAVGGYGAFGPFYSLTLDLDSLARAHQVGAAPLDWAAPCDTGAEARHGIDLLLPPENAESTLGRLRDAVAERHFTLVRLEARRASPEEVTLLRWADRAYVALRVEFAARATLGASVAAAQLGTRLIDIALDSGGSFMPGSLAWATRAQTEARYPMLGEFLAEQRRMDPGGRLCSPWLREAIRVWRGERCRVRFGDA